MARYGDTAGNTIITIDQCDCGSTGGCEKCKPLILPQKVDIEVFLSLFNEQWMSIYEDKGNQNL